MGQVWSFIYYARACVDVARSVSVAYESLAELRGITDQELTKKVKATCNLLDILEKGCTVLKNANEDLSSQVKGTLLSLQYLEHILKQSKFDDTQRYVPEMTASQGQAMQDVYNKLKAVYDKLYEDYENLDAGKSEERHVKIVALKFKKWITTPSMKEEFEKLEDIVKDAVKKSIELTTVSTSIAVNRLNIQQHFIANRSWPVTDNLLQQPLAPQLWFKEQVMKFVLSWKRDPTHAIDFYELCYDEVSYDEGWDSSITLNGSDSETEIGLPKVQYGKAYTMKIRGINAGGPGRWSNSVLARFTNPPPLKPDPPKVKIVSHTTAAVTVISPDKSCETESPVTKWIVEYAIDKEWTPESFKVTSLSNKYKCHIKHLLPHRAYLFRVQAINPAGSSEFSRPVSVKTIYCNMSIGIQVFLCLLLRLLFLYCVLWYIHSYMLAM